MRTRRVAVAREQEEHGSDAAAFCGVRLVRLRSAVCADASAQAYPSAPVRIVVPYPPGGGTDILSRSMAPKLSEAWSQPVIVDNRGGANGNIGAAFVAKAPADGHTILVTPIGFAVNPSLYKDLPFDALRDFAPVSQLADESVRPRRTSVPAAAQREGTDRLPEGASR